MARWNLWGALCPILVLLLAVLVRPAHAVVTLVSFTATAGDGQVLLRWETATEIDSAGFFIRRSIQQGGDYDRISRFIPSRGDGLIGAIYTYLDDGLQNGTTYYYVLEALENDQDVRFHGPVFATPEGTATPTETATASLTLTHTPTATPSPSSTPPAPTHTASATATLAAEATHTPLPTPMPTDTPTPTPTATVVSTDTPTAMPTFTSTLPPTRTPSPTSTAFPTDTSTSTLTPTASLEFETSHTPLPLSTGLPSGTPTATPTLRVKGIPRSEPSVAPNPRSGGTRFLNRQPSLPGAPMVATPLSPADPGIARPVAQGPLPSPTTPPPSPTVPPVVLPTLKPDSVLTSGPAAAPPPSSPPTPGDAGPDGLAASRRSEDRPDTAVVSPDPRPSSGGGLATFGCGLLSLALLAIGGGLYALIQGRPGR